MCFNCFTFEHLKNQYGGKEICQLCGNSAHAASETCPNKETEPVCPNYRQNYLPRDKSCPECTLQSKVPALAASNNLPLETCTEVVHSEPSLHFSS